jgi:hypothetical protein
MALWSVEFSEHAQVASVKQQPTAPVGGRHKPLLPVLVDEKYGFIDTGGLVVVEPQYVDASNFSEGLAPVLPGEEGLWGYVDQTGTMVIEPQFFGAGSFAEGLAPVQWEELGDWGYIDQTGAFYIEPQFYYATPYSHGRAAVRAEDQAEWSYIDQTWKVIWPSE